ncbi:MAG: PhzF family phenazine biosynthesis protein [Methanobacteriaceae archaeon]|jgi:PhzF family phenazine biosynthesis protein|nr:PhzF family phenazine biosynthesis protein [Candidatus Methanorudis spinitermitis]
MKYKLYQVDTFTKKLFGGNPAGVCPLNEWLDDNLLQKIAMENNLAETAFYVKGDNHYEIRWFTPKVEVDLCGHATLAAAFIIFNHENYSNDCINFYSPRSGELKVKKKSTCLTLDFPVDEFQPIAITDELVNCFDKPPVEAYKGKADYMLIFEKESHIADIQPKFEIISKLNARGVIITAKSENVDFVSRFFAPQSGILEDHVTGSAYTTLIPYWTEKLNKTELSSIQLSKRKGYLLCKLSDTRVEISGQAKLYLIGEIFID